MNAKRNRVLLVLAVVGIFALVGAAAWSIGRYQVYRRNRHTLHEYLNLLCTTMAVRTVIEIKKSVEMMTSLPGSNMKASGSHIVTTPEIDADVEKAFAGRDFETAAMGAQTGDEEKLRTVYKTIEAKDPETARKCAALRKAMDGCLPSFPYYDEEPNPECKTKHVGPATENLARYLRRNFGEFPTESK